MGRLAIYSMKNDSLLFASLGLLLHFALVQNFSHLQVELVVIFI